MSHTTTARRGAVLTLLATLVSTAAVIAGAGPASAAACTGKVSNGPYSGAGISYVRAGGATGGLNPGERKTESLSNPVVKFWIPSAARVSYWDLRTSLFLATHYPDNGGTYHVNPCHQAIVEKIY